MTTNKSSSLFIPDVALKGHDRPSRKNLPMLSSYPVPWPNAADREEASERAPAQSERKGLRYDGQERGSVESNAGLNLQSEQACHLAGSASPESEQLLRAM